MIALNIARALKARVRTALRFPRLRRPKMSRFARSPAACRIRQGANFQPLDELSSTAGHEHKRLELPSGTGSDGQDFTLVVNTASLKPSMSRSWGFVFSTHRIRSYSYGSATVIFSGHSTNGKLALFFDEILISRNLGPAIDLTTQINGKG